MLRPREKKLGLGKSLFSCESRYYNSYRYSFVEIGTCIVIVIDNDFIIDFIGTSLD